jgi:SAM-dependent methyltransferase
MAHGSQALYFYFIREKFPQYFKDTKVLDVGSLNINGCNKLLFGGCDYTGIDLGEGDNVDLVCVAHEHDVPDGYYDVIISSECFEHDMHIEKTLQNIYRMLRPGGLFTFTCAADNRHEHGTLKCDPEASPFTSKIDEWCNYYRGLNIDDVKSMLDFDNLFDPCEFQMIEEDLHFFGIKKSEEQIQQTSQESFDDYASHNAVSRLVKTPHYIVCGTVEGHKEDLWFVVQNDLLFPINNAFGSNMQPMTEDQIKIKHQGEMLLKEDLGCMNTKTE